MLENTRAIILHHIKYSDSGIIVHAYTRKFGRQSILVRGVGKKKSGKHNIMFQPLYILDISVHVKPSREIQMLKDASVSFAPFGIQSDIMKTSVALFLGEVLSTVLREENPNEALFDYLEQSVKYFDASGEDFSNFHIAFLSGLTSWLGFEPSRKMNVDDRFFDMQNGRFVPVPPLHSFYASEQISGILASIFTSSYESAGKIPMNGKLRNEVLDTLLRFYFLHLPSLKKINSIRVLKEVFG